MRNASRWFFACIATVVTSFAVAGHVNADSVAVTLGNTWGPSLGNGPFTLGWKFSLNSAVSVTGLGVFDSNLDGLADSHDVGIFDSVGNLLVSATVASGTANPLIHQFRYASASVLLTPGTLYDIGTVWGNDADGFLCGDPLTTDFATDPSINYWTGAYVFGGSLSAPWNFFNQGNPVYFGPNFTFTSVPEIDPAGMGSIAALVSGALCLLERRRLKTA